MIQQKRKRRRESDGQGSGRNHSLNNESLAGLKCFIVPQSCKDRLLASDRDLSAGLQANDLISRLQKWNPVCKDIFRPKVGMSQDTPLKLIYDSLSPSDVNSTPSFITLSYCWFDGSWSRARGYEENQSNGTPWPLSVQMMKHLLRQRASALEGIWIDQLSIDQDNANEKSLLIGHMDLIYSSSRLTVIALEDVLLTRREVELIRSKKLYDYTTETRSTFEESKELFELAYKIFSARWFSRAWCAHELQLCRDSVFLVPSVDGIIELSEDGLDGLYHQIAYFPFEEEDNDLSGDRRSVIEKGFSTVSHFETNSEDPNEGFGKAYITKFDAFLELGCKFEIDKISISLNVTRLPLNYVGGSKTTDEIQLILLLLAIAAGDADALCGTGDFIQSNSILRKNSLLRWQDNVYGPSYTQGAHAISHWDSIHEIDPERTYVDLLHLQDLGFNHATDAQLQASREFMSHCCQFIAGFTIEMRISSNYREGVDKCEMNACIQILACSLACGLEWIERQTSSYPSEPQQDWFEDLSKEMENITTGPEMIEKFEETSLDQMAEELEADAWLKLWHAAEVWLLPQLNGVNKHKLEHSQRVAIVFYIVAVMRNMPFFAQYSREFGFYDIDAAESETDKALAWVQLDGDKKAITFSPKEDELKSIQNAVYVIPKCLSGEGCPGALRLWLMDNHFVNQEKAFALISKAPFFTFSVMNSNTSCVELLHKQLLVPWVNMSSSYDS